jgi:outer membrane protein insertion porin family
VIVAKTAASLLPLLALLAPAAARAQGDDAPAIVSVEADAIPGEDAAAASGLAPGQRLTRALARQAIRNLWSTGRVSDVRVLSRPVAGGVAVRLRLRLNQVVRGLELEYPGGHGGPALERQQVASAIGYYAGMEWQPESLDRMTAALEAAYAERGYPDARVEGAVEVSPNDPGSISLRLTVTEGEPLRLASVDFSGPLGLPVDELRRQLRLDEGHVYDQVALREGIDRVLQHYRSQGYFEARIDPASVVTTGVQAERAGSASRLVRLVIPVQAGDHYTVDYVGNRWITDEDLTELLQLDQEEHLTRAVLDSLALRIRDRYRAVGFYHAEVEWRAWQTRPGERMIAFRIRSGPQVRVQSIDFTGNDHFTDRHLRHQVEAQLDNDLGQKGLFRPVSDDVASDLGVAGEAGYERWRERPRGHPALQYDPAKVFHAETYAAALEHIRDLYNADGYLAAKLGEPQLRFSDRGRELAVTIAVEEGPQTVIRAITFSGNAALEDAQILSGLGLEVGAPLNRYEVEQARRRVVRAYHDEGYVFTEVAANEYVDEDHLSADIHFTIEEGPRVRVGEVIVRGNEHTRTSLVRDRINLHHGSVYTPDAANASERSLVDLGIFTTVSITLENPDEPAEVKNLVVEVVERPPQLIDASIGFSTADGPRLGLRYSYRNLGGYGLSVDLRLQFSFQVFFLGSRQFEEKMKDLEWIDRLERLVVASFNVPHLPRVGRVLSIRIDATHERNNNPAYFVTRNSVNLSLNATFRPHFTAQLQSGYAYSDVFQVQSLPNCNDPSVTNPQPEINCFVPNRTTNENLRAPQGVADFWVTRLLFSADYRDNPFNPTRGFFGSLVGEHVVSLGPADDHDPTTPNRSSNLLKLTVTANGYIPLYRNLVLALQARFGWIFELTRDSYTFPDRFFYLGGFDSMRGFYEESLKAEDVPEPGGNAMLNLRAELRIPLPSSFALGVFLDTGNIWRDQLNFWRDFDLRFCLGVGLRYNTPVGPLALDAAMVLDRRANDGRHNEYAGYNEGFGAIQFAIGLF